MKLTDTTPDLRQHPTVIDLKQGDVFRFSEGLPARSVYQRVYYIKGSGEKYTQLTGPSAGMVYEGVSVTASVERVHGHLHVRAWHATGAQDVDE